MNITANATDYLNAFKGISQQVQAQFPYDSLLCVTGILFLVIILLKFPMLGFVRYLIYIGITILAIFLALTLGIFH